jgi:uncharacterized membrane protein YtjA (UPF0391 family)
MHSADFGWAMGDMFTDGGGRILASAFLGILLVFPVRPERKGQFYGNTSIKQGYVIMLRWAVVFLIIALIAGALGIYRTSFIASETSWILFIVFLILFLVSLVLGRGRPA